MNTAMGNLILEIDNMVKLGTVNDQCAEKIKAYIENVGYREEEINIKHAWVHSIFSKELNTYTTADEYFSKSYKQIRL